MTVTCCKFPWVFYLICLYNSIIVPHSYTCCRGI